MCVVTWEVFGPDFEVDEFLSRFPELGESAVWHKGQKMPLRRVNEHSGFSLTIFEGKSPSGAMEAIRRAVGALSGVRAALVGLNVCSQLSIGLYVGSKESFVPRLSFDGEDMRFLADAGVAVEVLGYPVSDED